MRRLFLRVLVDMRHVFSRRYIESTWFLTRISLKRQYRESFLGILWSIIQPSIHITVLSFVFSYLMRTPVKDYGLYVMGGMLPWTLLLNSFNGGAMALIARAGLVRGGCVLPKTMFIVSDVLVNVYIFFISFVTMYVIIGTFFAHLSLAIVFWPIVVIPVIGTCICAAIAFAYMAPYVKDTSHMVTICMNALFWTVPIAYPLAMVPADRQWFYSFNPFFLLIRPVQTLVHDGTFPSPVHLAEAFGVMFATMFVAWVIHHKLRRDVVYYL